MNSTDRDAIDLLLSDHQQIKDLLTRLVEDDGTDGADVTDQLKAILVIHNATEENLVYPAIHSLAQRPIHARTLYHQQDDAAVAFWELGNLEPGDAEFQRQAADFRDAVLAHIQQEEEHEFPHLREALAPEDALQLADEVYEFRQTFGSLAGGS
jgi:hemerythrin superfamily protein